MPPLRSLSLSRSGFAVDAIFAGLKFQSSIAGFTNSISAVTAWVGITTSALVLTFLVRGDRLPPNLLRALPKPSLQSQLYDYFLEDQWHKFAPYSGTSVESS